MNDLKLHPHALAEMARDNITTDVVHAVVADADEVIERDDGRTVYTRRWEGTVVVVVAEGDLVVTVWENKRGRSRRGRE